MAYLVPGTVRGAESGLLNSRASAVQLYKSMQMPTSNK